MTASLTALLCRLFRLKSALKSPTQARASNSVLLIMFSMTANISVSSALNKPSSSLWSVGKYVLIRRVLDYLEDITTA